MKFNFTHRILYTGLAVFLALDASGTTALCAENAPGRKAEDAPDRKIETQYTPIWGGPADNGSSAPILPDGDAETTDGSAGNSPLLPSSQSVLWNAIMESMFHPGTHNGAGQDGRSGPESQSDNSNGSGTDNGSRDGSSLDAGSPVVIPAHSSKRLPSSSELSHIIRYFRTYVDPEITFAYDSDAFVLPGIFSAAEDARAYLDPTFYLSVIDRPLPVPEKKLSMLKERIVDMLKEESGIWSVYVKDLTSGRAFTLGYQPMRSASLMKLFIMGAVYDAFENGEMERTDENLYLMSGMISASSNENSNELLRKLGGGRIEEGIVKVNRYIRENGYSEYTREYNGFQSYDAIVDGAHFNQTTVRDCGRLLEKVYRREFGTRRVCQEIEEWMLGQSTRYKIPAGVEGSGVQVGNKTGETDTVENDAAIVYTPYTDYIICIMSQDWNDKNHAVEVIKSISAETLAYFCDENYVRDRLSFFGEA